MAKTKKKKSGPPKVSGSPKVTKKELKFKDCRKGDLVQWNEDRAVRGFVVAVGGLFLGDGTIEVRQRGETLGTYQHVRDLKRIKKREELERWWEWL